MDTKTINTGLQIEKMQVICNIQMIQNAINEYTPITIIGFADLELMKIELLRTMQDECIKRYNEAVRHK